MCKCLKIHPSGYYAWMKNPISNRTIENEKFLKRIRASWSESGEIYGYRKIHRDLIDEGFKVSPNRVYRIMKLNNIKAKVGYKRKKFKYGKPSKVSENVLKQEFSAGKPNEIWVGDTTYIDTKEGWLFLATIIDLFSRKVVGWAMSSRNDTKLTTDSIMMAIKHRKPKKEVVFHSDQGVQYSSISFMSTLKSNNIMSNMSP